MAVTVAMKADNLNIVKHSYDRKITGFYVVVFNKNGVSLKRNVPKLEITQIIK